MPLAVLKVVPDNVSIFKQITANSCFVLNFVLSTQCHHEITIFFSFFLNRSSGKWFIWCMICTLKYVIPCITNIGQYIYSRATITIILFRNFSSSLPWKSSYLLSGKPHLSLTHFTGQTQGIKTNILSISISLPILAIL